VRVKTDAIEVFYALKVNQQNTSIAVNPKPPALDNAAVLLSWCFDNGR
jgi:hypothetical protein